MLDEAAQLVVVVEAPVVKVLEVVGAVVAGDDV
jgi:hypothetical protein